MIVDGMMINAEVSDVIKELKSQLAEQGIELFAKTKDSGKDVMTQCPYHKDGQERNPSMGIRKEDGMCHCFACGETHPLTEMIGNCFGRTDPFNEFGKRWLRDNFGISYIEDRKLDLNLSREPETHEECQQFVSEEELDNYRYYHPYMRERGLTDDVIELFDIGYDKKTDSITFPVRDIMSGRCKFIARRKIRYKQFDLPKDVDKPLYGLYEIYNLMSVDYFSNNTTAPARLSEIYVCEGLFDCLRLWCNGKVAVAGFGCLFSDYQIKQLEYLPTRKLIFALDNDNAGIIATERLKRLVKGKIMTTVILPDGRKDIGECTDEEIMNLRETLY